MFSHCELLAVISLSSVQNFSCETLRSITPIEVRVSADHCHTCRNTGLSVVPLRRHVRPAPAHASNKETLSIYLSIYLSLALQSTVRPWQIFKIFNPIQSR
jgi:hypothetical protein